MKTSYFEAARSSFHLSLLKTILTVSNSAVPSNADSSSKLSISYAQGILERIGTAQTGKKVAGQTAGNLFEEACRDFIEQCFSEVMHLRPGDFTVVKGGDISGFDQYSHLDELEAIAKENKEIATALGSDYLIKPDILVARKPEPDSVINKHKLLVNNDIARLSSVRAANQSMDILHASISCKWTLRSDRAQNARSEGLNLVRNRKGRLPHVAVITAEPTPNRIASLALGTGDIDCVYHFALPELKNTLAALGREDSLDMLETMIDGKRLRDISDLPLDLVI